MTHSGGLGRFQVPQRRERSQGLGGHCSQGRTERVHLCLHQHHCAGALSHSPPTPSSGVEGLFPPPEECMVVLGTRVFPRLWARRPFLLLRAHSRYSICSPKPFALTGPKFKTHRSWPGSQFSTKLGTLSLHLLSPGPHLEVFFGPITVRAHHTLGNLQLGVDAR